MADCVISAGAAEVSLNGFEAGEPMWKIVPTRDENGKLLSDFMMLIPKLREQSPIFIQTTVSLVRRILGSHSAVKFVNFNIRLNLLWISHRSVPGVGLELVARIQNSIPQALLIAQKITPRN